MLLRAEASVDGSSGLRRVPGSGRLEGIAQQHPEPLGAKLNVDENPATATKYGIRSLPTMVVFQNGKVAKTITGVKSTTALEKDLVKFLTKAR
ncbi:thioredoxin domain-containing protein [Streptomyces goshikiensis]|uniref:thioredoxin domain-containing protein n=1 Tax=Streptomyces goshikiensis TaxID=1942 RepID=UPI0036B72BFF